MKKINKKGFTLIEMLVVIAIIAVLVAIIIPVVSGSTQKAKCATNAANLRSVKAELVIQYVNTGKFDAAEAENVAKRAKFYNVGDDKGKFKAELVGEGDVKDIKVTYADQDIAYWAAKAGEAENAGQGAAGGNQEGNQEPG